MDDQSNRLKLLLMAMPAALALDLVPGWAAIHWNLPIYLDAIGTLMATLLCGWRLGAAVGVISVLLGGFINPHLPYFVLSQFTIALVAGISAKHGGFKSVPRTLLTGVLIGIAAAIVSAPAVALAFGDESGGTSAFACFLSETKEHLRLSFASQDIWIEPVDKILQCTFAAALIAALPKTLLSRFDSQFGLLGKNKFI